jgi:hypothetical protein
MPDPTIEQLIALIEFLDSKEIKDATIDDAWWGEFPEPAADEPSPEES